jgi:Tfp pilus assembly protein PilO
MRGSMQRYKAQSRAYKTNMRFIIPVTLLIAAIGLFVMYTNPTYAGLKDERVVDAAYSDALGKAKELRARREELERKQNAFEPENQQKLARLIPDQVDNIRLIIDINNIAARHGLSLSGVALGEVSNSSREANTLSVGPSSEPVGSVSLGFSVTASYEEFLAFLQDLEHSLRILDIEKLSFTSGETLNKYSFDFTIRTYWLH